MYIWVRSRHFVQNIWEPIVPTDVVSIYTPGDSPAILPKSNLIKRILRLCFDDISFENPELIDEEAIKAIKQEHGYTVFDEEMARGVAEFLRDFNEECLLCHCDAGVSRSAGVAAAFAYHLCGDDTFFFEEYIPNRIVYRKTLDALASKEG